MKRMHLAAGWGEAARWLDASANFLLEVEKGWARREAPLSCVFSAWRALNNRDCILCGALRDDRLWSTRQMRSPHCRSNAFDLLSHSRALTHAVTGAYTWTRSGYGGLHARRGTGDATRPVKSHAGCSLPNACTQLNSWHSRSCLRVKSNSFHSEAAHITPNLLKARVGVTTVWYTSAPNRKICKDLIRRKSGHCSKSVWVFFFFFSSLCCRNEKILEVFILSASFSWQRSVWSCLFWERVLWVNLQCNQLVTVIYVMFFSDSWFLS